MESSNFLLQAVLLRTYLLTLDSDISVSQWRDSRIEYWLSPFLRKRLSWKCSLSLSMCVCDSSSWYFASVKTESSSFLCFIHDRPSGLVKESPNHKTWLSNILIRTKSYIIMTDKYASQIFLILLLCNAKCSLLPWLYGLLHGVSPKKHQYLCIDWKKYPTL